MALEGPAVNANPLQAVPASPGGELSPAQRKFNQLLQRLDEARATLQAWDLQQPAFARAYADRAQPLWADLLTSDEQLHQRLARLVDSRALSRPEQARVSEHISHRALDVLQRRNLSEADRSHWRSVHDAHAERSFAELQAEELVLLREQLTEMTGIDLSDRDYRDEAELMDTLRQRRAAAQADAERAGDAPPPRRKQAKRQPTAAQAQRAADEAAAQTQAQASLRTVFRKLASALHPDRASSEHDRLRRTALMQRVNEAYGREDLLALYALQLEIEQVDAAHIARATAAQLAHFTRLLQTQLAELQADIDARAHAFCYDYQLQPARLPKPHQLPGVLDGLLNTLRHRLLDNAHLARTLGDPVRTKHWLRELRRASED